jgi:hypothetical protein
MCVLLTEYTKTAKTATQLTDLKFSGRLPISIVGGDQVKTQVRDFIDSYPTVATMLVFLVAMFDFLAAVWLAVTFGILVALIGAAVYILMFALVAVWFQKRMSV